MKPLARAGRSAATALMFGVIASASGCFAVVDLDRFHDKAQPLGTQQTNGVYTSLRFAMIGMKPHVGHNLEYRIVDANNMVQSRGVVRPLGPGDVTVNVPRGIPKINGPYRLDFFADVNASGGYDGLGSVISNDHAWRIDPLADYPEDSVKPVDGLTQVAFVHNTSFTDIDQYPSGTPNKAKDTGLGVHIHVIGADAAMGKVFEIRVAEAATKHTVALYRVNQLSAASFDATVPGCVDTGVDYEVSVYADANGNGTYESPADGPGDLGWKLTATSDVGGLTLTFDASVTTNANVDVGAP